MLFKDRLTKENLLKYYVKHETNTLYFQGIEELKSKGFSITAIVCDGRRGLMQLFNAVSDKCVSSINRLLLEDI